MNKKFKLFFSLSALCFSLAVLCFGVYSAMSVSYSISGSVSYEVTDAFVDITTTVYGSNAIATSDEELLSLANEFVNAIPTTIGENKIVTHFTNYDDVFDFNSLTDTLDENNGYTPEASLDMTFGSEQNTYSYFVVVNIKNLADNVVYTNIASMTDNLTGVSIVATDSDLRIFSDQMEGQSIVFAYAISDLTQNQENVPIEFSLEFTCQAPYTYADISYNRGAFLDDYNSEYLGGEDYSNKLKSVIFTNNQADFDMSKVVDSCDVGDVYDEDGIKVGELYTYFIPNGDLYDAYCYAPVNVIYAPSNANALFCEWHLTGSFTGYDDIRYVWQQNYLTTLNFKAFDVSKSIDIGSLISFNNVSEIENMYFDTSNVTDFTVFFSSSTLTKKLDLSSFSFESVDSFLSVACMIGINDTYLEYFAQQFSAISQVVSLINSIIDSETIDEKIALFADLIETIYPDYSETKAALGAKGIYNTSIQKIICPKDLNGLVIATPGETPYLIEGTNETTYYLVEGATLIAQN